MKLEKKLELMKILFNPKSVAIIGATENVMKIGGIVTFNVRGSGFKKSLYAINPNPKYQNKKILGVEVYPSIDKCPEPIDLVGIVVPPPAVLDSIQQAIECDIKTAVIITAGFGEVKSEDRQDANKELIRIADKAGMIFVGPNSLGIYSSEDEISPINLEMGLMSPLPGKVAIISQSGTIGNLVANAAKRIRYFISSGNEASLIMEDYLEYFAQDEKISHIALFVEGLRDGLRFKRISSEIIPKKPIILLKAGITDSGTRAAFSHTSSISGAKKIYESVFKQTGIIQAENITEFTHLVKAAPFLLPLPDHEPLRVGLISGGGGYAVHLADLCEKIGLEVVDLNRQPDGQKLIEELSKYLPFYWSKNNPFDLVATRDFNLLPKVIDIILQYDFFDIIISQTAAIFTDFFKLFHPVDEIGKKMKDLAEGSLDDMIKSITRKEIKVCLKNPQKKIIFFSPLPQINNPIVNNYEENGILVFAGNPEIVMIVIRKLHDYQKFVNRRS